MAAACVSVWVPESVRSVRGGDGSSQPPAPLGWEVWLNSAWDPKKKGGESPPVVDTDPQDTELNAPGAGYSPRSDRGYCINILHSVLVHWTLVGTGRSRELCKLLASETRQRAQGLALSQACGCVRACNDFSDSSGERAPA